MPNKPWKSFEDQLEILKSRGLIIDNDVAALDYLDRVGYYRLSGYWYSFRKLELQDLGNNEIRHRRIDQFVEGSHFEHAVKLYVFDKKLRLLALDALERIELTVRVDIAYLLGERDVHAHENPNIFHGRFSRQKQRDGTTRHENWLEKHNVLIHRARRVPFVSHYLNNHGKLPIWVAIEIWDFGLLSKLYAGLKPEDQNLISEKYLIKNGKTFAGWLRSLNFIRNVCAHHSRLWNINVLERANLIEDDKFWQQSNSARPFYYFCIMQRLMNIICPNSRWHEKFIELMNEFPEVAPNTISLKNFGLIDDWENWDLWKWKRKPTRTQ